MCSSDLSVGKGTLDSGALTPLSACQFLRETVGMRKLLFRTGVSLVVAFSLGAQYRGGSSWLEPGGGDFVPASGEYENAIGTLGVINANGYMETNGHPFFMPLGTNGRACVSCHQPVNGMSVSAAGLLERWETTRGMDPVFAAFDGANCPNLPQLDSASHSLLLNRGLFRVPLAWPPVNADGSAKQVDFSIEVVHDPTGCNTSAEYGLKSEHPMVSVYRRPRPSANLRYVISGGTAVVEKTGERADVDPDTGKPSSMNFMADAREVSLISQARSAIMGHEQALRLPTREELEKIVAYESQVYMAQVHDGASGILATPGAPVGLGPLAMRDGKAGVHGDNASDPVFRSFATWASSKDSVRASIARGADLFMNRKFAIRDTAYINTSSAGNSIQRTCATCHSAQMTGQDMSAGWVDVGTTNIQASAERPAAIESSELPVFKITCNKDAQPHPFLGRTINTTDPGRAMISGKCADVGSIVMQQLRGLSARAPYFVNGSAKTLRDVVEFYEKRYDMKLTDAEKTDLVNFLGAL